MERVDLIIVGCGNRGFGYSRFALENPEKLKIVAVADPLFHRRKLMMDSFKLDESCVFMDWRDIIKVEDKLAIGVLICLQDRDHYEATIAFAKKGYHILLEKPMSVSLKECDEMVKVCNENNIIFSVCHVLKYTPQNKMVHTLLSKDRVVGDVLNVQHLEPVGHQHFSHSFVRGNWRKEDESSFSLLTKCCHDVDLLSYWMNGINEKEKYISSSGQLKHFKKSMKPKNAGNAKRCIECVLKDSCNYSATQIYLDRSIECVYAAKEGNYNWPVNVITNEKSVDSVYTAIENGPYGRCVYECDNDVIDNQVVLIEYESGCTSTLSMVSTTEKVCERYTRFFGSEGEIIVNEKGISVFSFKSKERREIKITNEVISTSLSGHGYADYHLMSSFVEAIRTNNKELILTDGQTSLYSHKITFLAEQARKKRIVIDINDW